MTRHVTQDCIALVKRFEGFRSRAYLCPANVWTIGYGTTYIGGRPVTAITPDVTEITADALLVADLVRFEQSVFRLIKVPLADGQFDALVDFAYNFGAGKLQSSTPAILIMAPRGMVGC